MSEITKKSQKIIDQYNRQCDAIASQSLQLDKVKAKLSAITEGNVQPTSIKNLEKELNSVNKELASTQAQYDAFADKLASAEFDLQIAQSLGDEKGQLNASNTLKELEAESWDVAGRLNDLQDKSAQLSAELKNAKLNPESSTEAVQLQKQIDVLSSKLETSKDKANGLKNELNNALDDGKYSGIKKVFSNMSSGVQSVGSSLMNFFGNKNPLNSMSQKLTELNKRVSNFGKRITGLIASALIFNVMSSALSNLSQGLIGVLKSNSQFASSLNQIKANLLTAFAPIYEYVLPAINSLMSALSGITGSIASFVSNLFGKTTDESKKSAQALYNQAQAYKDAGKEAKDASGNLASFDKLEVINDTSKGSSNNADTIDFSQPISESSKLLDYLNKIKELVSQGDFFGVGELFANSVNNFLNSIDVVAFTDKVNDILQGTVQVFNGFVNGLDWSLLGTKFSQLTVGLTGAVANAIDSINWSALGQGISDFIANIDLSQLTVNIISIFINAVVGITEVINNIDWKMVGSKLGDAIKSGLNTIYEAIKEIDWEQLGKDIGNFLMSIDWLGILVELVKIIGAGLASLQDVVWGLIQSIIEGILNIDWGQVGTQIVDLIMTTLQLLYDYFFGIFPKVVDAILNIDWSSVGQNILDWITNALSGFTDWISNLFNDALNAIHDIFSGIGNWFTEVVWGGIKNAFSNVTNWFRDKFSEAWQAVKSVFSSGGRIFDGIKDGILSGLKAVVNAIINGINKVIKVPFDGINSALKKIKKVDILGLRPFSWISTINVPQIPQLATGAVIPPNSKFLAVLGDQTKGNNLEAPESLIRKIVREESGDKEVILNATFIVKCDDIELGKASLRGLRLMEEKNGKKYLVN